MFHTRVKSGAVGRRLDAGFYNPEYVAAQNAVARFPIRTMESLRADGAPIGYGVVKPRFQDSSVRMVRIQDFSDPFVDLESSASIDPVQMTEFKRSACQPGDLLVAIGGYPGRLGLLPPLPASVSAVNINQHVVRMRFAAGVERYFVTAFLMSSTGGRILARQVSGSVQAGINVEDFRLITVPFVGADAQRYIGDKVRQAERLRERARNLELAAHHSTVELIRNGAN
jgi:type I restriction enzyme S subunit